MALLILSHSPLGRFLTSKRLLAATLPVFSGLVRIYRAQALEQTVGVWF
jgi:hypothetical protein